MTDGILFGGWDAIACIVVVGVLAYAAIVLVVLLSGKRSLASMNAFDFIVNIAIGSVLATTIVARSTPLLDGIAAFLVLFGLQFAVTLVTSRSKRAGRIVRSEPRLLVHDSTLLFDAMREERVSESEILQALRSEGSARSTGPRRSCSSPTATSRFWADRATVRPSSVACGDPE